MKKYLITIHEALYTLLYKMNMKLILIIFLFCLCHFSYSEENVDITLPQSNDWEKIKNLPSRTFPVPFQFKSSIPAKQVSIAGSFNGWEPGKTLLNGPDENGIWSLTLDLPEGTIQYKFVVDGDKWFHDSNNPNKVDDGHNGFNSVMEISPLMGISTTCQRGDGNIYTEAVDHYPSFPDIERVGENQVKIQLTTWKNDIESVNLVYLPEGKNQNTKIYPMILAYSDKQFDYYQTRITITSQTSGYYFQLHDGKRILGFGMMGNNKTYEFPVVIDNLPYVSSPDWAKKAVWYQIFPERFRNGDTANDILGNRTPSWTSDWFKLEPWEQGDFYSNVYNRFYGGDLQGIIEKLPYLKELGTNAIYFNPVFMSPSIHGYDTMDYRHINPHFGYLEDTVSLVGETLDPQTWKFTKTDLLFLKLIQECHKNEIKVIIDGVFNHTGDQFWAFKDLLMNGKNSPYKDWYKVIDFGPPVKYQGWWGSQQLPEINQDSTGPVHGIREHIFNITKRCMDPNGDGDPSDGIDGWRLDVPDLVSHTFWKEWGALVRKINPNAYITGELWGRATDWTQGDQFDAVMNYEFIKRVYKFFINTDQNKKYSVSQFDRSLHELLSWYPYNVNYVMQNLLDSHDTDRIASAILNPNREFDAKNRLQDADGKSYNWHKPTPQDYQRLKLIVLFQMTFVGAPMIWYGDEVGMWGADDPSDRKPMLWKDLEPYENPDDSVKQDLFNYYKKLISIRNQHEALQTGDFQTVLVDDTKNVYAYARTGKEKVIVVLNNTNKPQTISLPLNSGNYKIIFGNANTPVKPRKGKFTLSLPPVDGLILVPTP